MASLKIRNLNYDLKRRLRIRATRNGRSLEEEVREILLSTVGKPTTVTKNLGTAIHRRFAKYGGFKLDLPPREPMPEPPRFD